MSEQDPSAPSDVTVTGNHLPSMLPCSRCGSLGATAVHMTGDVWPDVQYYRCAICAYFWSLRLARTVTP
jgi:formate dehydrogenase maturation protein FdhE